MSVVACAEREGLLSMLWLVVRGRVYCLCCGLWGEGVFIVYGVAGGEREGLLSMLWLLVRGRVYCLCCGWW